MEAGKRTINDIFNGNRILEIPFFQRSYVWGEKEWVRFLSDMEYVSSNNRTYFLGSVILKQQEAPADRNIGDIRILIDGQQRLTTLNIFFKVLSLKIGQAQLFDTFRLKLRDNRIAISHNRNDRDSFERIMNLETIEEVKRDENNIFEGYMYFVENLEVEKIDFHSILTNIMFVGIDLTTDDDEQQIFDTTNSLGVDLTTADLLKNYFFGRNDVKLFIEHWQNVFEKDKEIKDYWDTEIVAGRLQRELIDLFFYSFLQIRIQDPSINVKNNDKSDYSKASGLFNSYKSFISNYGIEKLKLIAEIKEYADLFRENFDKSIINKELPADRGIERINCIIWGLETTTLIPYVLYIIKNVKDTNEREKIFGYLESYVMRRMICHENTKNYNRLFSESLILNNIQSKEDLKDFIDKKSEKSDYMPTDDDLKKAFQESKLINSQAAGILYLMESKIRDQKHGTLLKGLSQYSLEHIMPKKWRNNWNNLQSEEMKVIRDKKLYTLGNLTIITQSLNTSIRDANWDVKKKGQGSQYGLVQFASGLDTFSKYMERTEWNESVIEERANFLCEMAVKIWKT